VIAAGILSWLAAGDGVVDRAALEHEAQIAAYRVDGIERQQGVLLDSSAR